MDGYFTIIIAGTRLRIGFLGSPETEFQRAAGIISSLPMANHGHSAIASNPTFSIKFRDNGFNTLGGPSNAISLPL